VGSGLTNLPGAKPPPPASPVAPHLLKTLPLHRLSGQCIKQWFGDTLKYRQWHMSSPPPRPFTPSPLSNTVILFSGS